MDVGGFHQEVEHLTEQRNRLMRFGNGSNMSVKPISKIPNPNDLTYSMTPSHGNEWIFPFPSVVLDNSGS
jgi:hypothetical protein